MKHGRNCPRCKGTVFFRIDTMSSPDYRYVNSFHPVGLAVADRTRKVGRFWLRKVDRLVVEIEAWVCKACGFTDLYAKDLEALQSMVDAEEGVEVVDRESDGGPFR